jgi:hypothetical protein
LAVFLSVWLSAMTIRLYFTGAFLLTSNLGLFVNVSQRTTA